MSLVLKALLLVSILSFTVLASTDGKCRALVLSASTDRASYQAGALAALVKNAVDANDFAYDVVTGVSTGALNAAIISQFPAGQEQKAVDALKQVWTTLQRDQVYSYWGGGYVEGLLFKTSLVDSSPFKSYLMRNINVPFQRKVVIGASNANTGNFDTFSEANLTSINSAVNAIMASSAMPLYFPYIDWNDATYLDGSLIMGANFADAVERCMEVVSSPSDIIVDVITTHGGELESVDAAEYNTLEVLVRFLEVYLYGWENFQYYLARLDYPEVNFRYIIKPTQSLPGSWNPLSFESTNIAKDIAMGEKDAEAILKTGRLGNAPELIEKAADWLHKNMGVFSHAKGTIKELNQRQKANANY